MEVVVLMEGNGERNSFKDFFAKFFRKNKSKAEEYLNDQEKAKELLGNASKKAEANKGPIDGIFETIQLVFSLIKDYSIGRYKVIPYKSILLLVVAIIYFVSPIDAIFDVIPILGLIDDAAVLGFVFLQLKSDLDCNKDWKTTTQQDSGM